MRLKRGLSLFLAIMIIFSLFSVCSSSFAQGEKRNAKLLLSESYKPKVINIVYDDSGSMVNGNSRE